MRLHLGVGNRTDRPDPDKKQPNKKQTKGDPSERATETINEPDGARRMLSGSLEEKRTETGDNAVNHDGEKRTPNHRHDEIRPFQNRAEQRQQKIAAEIPGGVSSDDGRASDQLPGKTESITANNFEKKQNDREGDEDGLPKR